MIRVYCDWCKQEAIGDYAAGQFGRRIAMTENGKFNVCVTFEFPVDDRPEHICIPCFCARIVEASEILKTAYRSARGETISSHPIPR